jgi:quercetin dioxygenase-like cupin family protein
MVSVLRIWADEAGESHFEDVDVVFEETDFVPPAPPVLVSSFEPASEYAIERVAPGWRGDWHPAPGRVIAIYLSGRGEMETSDGEVHPLEPGTILLAEDTTGKGHLSRVTGTEEMVVVILKLPD